MDATGSSHLTPRSNVAGISPGDETVNLEQLKRIHPSGQRSTPNTLDSYKLASIPPVLNSKPQWVSRAITKIEGVLHDNPTETQLMDTYKNISDELLSQEGVISERAENGEFLKVSIDPDLLKATRQLIVFFIEKRYAHYMALKTDQERLAWITKIVSSDVRKRFTGDLSAFRNEFDNTAQIGAWNYFIREKALKNHKEKDPAICTAFWLYYSHMTLHDISSQRNFDRTAEIKKKGITYKKCELDEVELYCFVTQIHNLAPFETFLKTHIANEGVLLSLKNSEPKKALPDTVIVNNLTCCLAIRKAKAKANAIAIANANANAKVKKDAFWLNEHGKVREIFLKKQQIISLAPSSSYKSVVAVLLPAKKKLLLVPGFNQEETSLKNKLVNISDVSCNEPVNIIYFSLSQENKTEIDELATYFQNIAQLSIVTPFRALANNKKLYPADHLWKYQNFTLMEKSLQPRTRGQFGLDFHVDNQVFTLTHTTDEETHTIKEISAPFTWSVASGKRPDQGMLWQSLGFLKSFHDGMRCAISHKTVDEIEDPCFDKNGQIYERECLKEWLKDNHTIPSTRESMTVADIQEMPILKQLVLSCKAISQRYPIADVQVAAESSYQQQPLPGTLKEKPFDSQLEDKQQTILDSRENIKGIHSEVESRRLAEVSILRELPSEEDELPTEEDELPPPSKKKRV